MTGENLPAKLENLADLPQKYSEKDFEAATAASYLPRVQLMTSNSNPCKSGEFPTNHYAIVRDQNYDDLGPDVDVVVLAWRPKALDMGEQVVSVFDPQSDEFARIQAESQQQDSGCMWGPEYLVYIPVKQQFATFFMGTKSARREAPALKALLRKAATLSAKKIKTSKYTWYCPSVSDCSGEFDLPPMPVIAEEIEKFNNPPATEVESAPAPIEGEREQ